MAINKLSGEVKAFIVRSLACFDTPSTVAEAVERQFGKTVTRQVVQCYNPHWRAGAKLSQQWRQLFEETRKAFVEETNKIGISHRNVRLRKLDQQVALAEERGDGAMIARLLRLAEMEMRPHTKGGELRGTAAQPAEHHRPISDTERAKAILLILARAKAERLDDQKPEIRGRRSKELKSDVRQRSAVSAPPEDGVAETRNQEPETGDLSQNPGPELARRSALGNPAPPQDWTADLSDFLTSDF